jgi:hypothetical protein
MTGFNPPKQHDPGGKVKLPILPGVHVEAYISDCGRYRHWLSRTWGAPTRYVLFIGKNPSEAATALDDPTIRKEIRFARDWGYNGIFKANVCDYRSTDPDALLDQAEPCSAENIIMIRKLAARASRIVICWGVMHPMLQHYADNVLVALQDRKLWCLGTTQDGNPCHPLFIPHSTQLKLYHGR